MVNDVADWFRSWSVSARRYRLSLRDRRAAQWSRKKLMNDYEQLKVIYDMRHERLDRRAEENLEASEEVNRRQLDENAALNAQLISRTESIEDLNQQIRMLQSDLAVAERDKENLAASNEMVRSEIEARQARFSSRKTRYLTEETRPSDNGGLL